MAFKRLTRFSLFAANFFLFTFFLPISTNALPLSPPLGACYDLNLKNEPLRVQTVKSIPCSGLHSTETYRIGTWTSHLRPHDLSSPDFMKVVNLICLPVNWPKLSELTNWFAVVPSRNEFNQGARWVRCDAVSLADEGSYNRWKGVRWSLSTSAPGDKQVTLTEVLIMIEPVKACFNQRGSVFLDGDKATLRDGINPRNYSSLSILASGSLYAREAGCGLGAYFKTVKLGKSKIVNLIDERSKRVIGTIDLSDESTWQITTSNR